MVGKDLRDYLEGYDVAYLSSKDGDLRSEADCQKIFETHKPNIVIHLAAKVGGILDNISKPTEYLEDNLRMNTNIVRFCREFNVERLIAILSTCAYPDVVANYPMTEEDLHLGPPAPTNFGYGISKRALATHIELVNKQFGLKYQYIIPSNLFGENDKFDAQRSHFVSALIAKIHAAIENGDDKITLFGDGTPLRQFMYSKDLARVIATCIKEGVYENMNVATENLSIDQIARVALKACNAEHLKIEYDTTKPNGQFRKDVSIGRLQKALPNFTFTPLEEGISKVYNYLKEHDKLSV